MVYWNKTRGINVDSVGANTSQVFDYYVDYKGNIFDAVGEPVVTKQDFEKLKDLKRGAYLGRTSDGTGITKEAKAALDTLSLTGVTAKTAKVDQTPYGWLRVRNAASLNGAEVGKVTSGNSYPVLAEQTGWVKVKVSDTLEGWVSSAYVTLSK